MLSQPPCTSASQTADPQHSAQQLAEQQLQSQQSGTDQSLLTKHDDKGQSEEHQHSSPQLAPTSPQLAPATPQLPPLTHQDLLHLQSHAADFAGKDRRDWLINLRFLRSSMQQAHWPGPIWSEDELLDVVGRIASNNFGIYTTRDRPQAQSQSICSQGTAQKDGAASAVVASPSGPVQIADGNGNQASAGESVNGSALPQAEHRSAFLHDSVPLWPMQADAAQLAKQDAGPHPDGPHPDGPHPDGIPTAASHAAGPGSQDLDSALGRLSVHEQPNGAELSGNGTPQQHPETQPIKAETGLTAAVKKLAKEDVIGREMYITASFFNHSCEPNCVKQRVHGQQAGTASVTAIQNIKVSSQLFLSCHGYATLA